MAKVEFNMSAAIRDALTENPNVTSAEVIQAIQAKYPKVKINKNSFSVGFYTARQKMGIVSKKRGKRVGIRRSAGGGIDMSVLQGAAKFLREAGGIENAIAAIKSVQAVQIG